MRNSSSNAAHRQTLTDVTYLQNSGIEEQRKFLICVIGKTHRRMVGAQIKNLGKKLQGPDRVLCFAGVGGLDHQDRVGINCGQNLRDCFNLLHFGNIMTP